MGASSWPPSGPGAAIVSRQLREPSWVAAAKAADAATTWLPNPHFLWGAGAMDISAGPMAIAPQKPTGNSPSVWQPLLYLFMALFSLINLKLVTFSSFLGC